MTYEEKTVSQTISRLLNNWPDPDGPDPEGSFGGPFEEDA